MANKRMFTNKITETDAFLDMPLSAQALYFHLNMNADDDGFLGNPKKVARMINASEDDLKLLIAKRFLIAFEDGVVVIKHWWMHNHLKSQIYTETCYIDERNSMFLKQNRSYSKNEGIPITGNISKMLEGTKCYKSATEVLQKCSKSVALDIDKDIDIDLGLDLDKGSEKEEGLEGDINISHSIDFTPFVDAWNRLADDLNLAKITKLNEKRRKKLKARLKEHKAEGFTQALDEIRNSDFLQGKTNGWKVTFDWLIENETNIQKVLEGNYRGRKLSPLETLASTFADDDYRLEF